MAIRIQPKTNDRSWPAFPAWIQRFQQAESQRQSHEPGFTGFSGVDNQKTDKAKNVGSALISILLLCNPAGFGSITKICKFL